MKFTWFNTKDEEAFGLLLAKFFIDRVPLEDQKKKNVPANKKAEIIKKMHLQIAQFKATHQLNIYKKAKLGNAFKWELKNKGYEEDLIDELTHSLMIQLK